MSHKNPNRLKPTLIVGYALGIFTIIFCVLLYFSLPTNELRTMIIIALISLAGASIVTTERFRRKLTRGEVKIRAVEHPISRFVAILLAVIPGLFGLLGIGHLYLGKKRRGTSFLLFGLLVFVLALVHPSAFSPEFAILMSIFAIVWIWQAIDVYRLA